MALTLTPVEAFRCQVLISDTLKKLEFLNSLSSNASGGQRDELTQFIGDEVSRIIREQRDLEKHYESLIALRGTLGGLKNKAKFMEVQAQIQDVGQKLRESNKTLHRNLEQNPNVEANQLKMHLERARVQDLLADTKGELLELSFSHLLGKVEEERRSQELLYEVRKKEQEASQAVIELEAELQREYADLEKENQLSNKEIHDLKEELKKLRTVTQIELAFEEKRLKAKVEAHGRTVGLQDAELQKEMVGLEESKKLENLAHEDCLVFLQQQIDQLNTQKQELQEKFELDKKERETKLTKLLEERGVGFEELEILQKRMEDENEQIRKIEEEQRNKVYIEKQRREQDNRMETSIIFLQEHGRVYIEKLRVIAAAKKGGKKGKKGKKK